MKRELNSKDRSAVQKYIEERYKYLEEHKFDERLLKLRTLWDTDNAEALDRDHQRACKHAAVTSKKKLRTVFVRKIASLRVQKQVLNKIVSVARLGKDFDIQIAHTMIKTNVFLIPESIDRCKNKLKEIQKELKQLEKDPESMRTKDLHKVIDNAIRAGDKKLAKEIKYKMKAEDTKKTFSKI